MSDEFTSEPIGDWSGAAPVQRAAPTAPPDSLAWPTASAPRPASQPVPRFELPATFVESAPRADAAPPAPRDETGGRGWHVREPQRFDLGWTPSPAYAGAATAVTPPPIAMPWDRPAPSRRPVTRYLLLAATLFAGIGGGVLALSLLRDGGPAISQPSSIGALTPVSTPAVDATLQSVQQTQRSAGASNVVAAVYGGAGRPTLLLLVEQNPLLSDGGTRAGLDNFMRGFAGGLTASGWRADAGGMTASTVDNTMFACEPMRSPQLTSTTLSTCVWTEHNVGGVVVDLSGQNLADTLNEAVQARAAAEH